MTETRRTPIQLRGATFNVLRRAPDKRDDLAAAIGRYATAHRLDFLLLQEIAGHHTALRSIDGYDLVAFPKSADRGDNGILIRHGVAHGPGVAIDVKAAWYTTKGRRFPARSIVTVGLDHWLRVTTVHAPVQVLNHSRRFRGPARRVTAYRITMRKLLAHARRVAKREPKMALVLAGDWNAGPATVGKGTPSWLAVKARMRIRSAARIDWPMYRGCHLLYVAVDRRPHNLGSDHPIVRFTVQKG